jgi:hypothetical protein
MLPTTANCTKDELHSGRGGVLDGRCALSEHCLGDPKRPKRAGDAGVDQLCHRPFAGACDHENVVGKFAGAGVSE